MYPENQNSQNNPDEGSNKEQPLSSQSPEQIAARAFSRDDAAPSLGSVATGKKLAPHKRLAKWHKNLSKKQKLILVFVALALIAGGCVAALKIRKSDSVQLTQVQVVKKPETVPSLLTGLPVKPEINTKQVTGVMIENSLDARPQSGLRDAGIVFEAVAEGGITRFLALYQDTDSGYIGPVRSVRPYYLDWLLGFDASVAHVGGSPQALKLVKSQKAKDLDQFANSGSYQRVSSRYAPHNVYTSTKKLDDLEKQKGFKKSTFTGFTHAKKEGKAAATVTAKTINMNLSGALYNVHYDYDAKSNYYLRSEGGKAHTDEKTGKQLTPKVVIAMVMSKSQNGVYSVYKTFGEGEVLIYQNGTVTKGKWKKKDAKSPLLFVTAENKAIQLNPGKAWITAVTKGAVSHKP